MSINSRVNSDCKDVLVVLREYSGVDNVAIIALLARVDVYDADDSSRASLDIDTAALVELVGEDVPSRRLVDA